MKKLLAVVAAAIALSFGLPGAANAGYYCSVEKELLRSINTDREERIGKVTAMCVNSYIMVIFDTSLSTGGGDGTWNLLETNAYVGAGGADCSEVPQNQKNNPQPGKFNTVAQVFKISDGAQMATHVYGISAITLPPLTTIVIIAAHATVRNTEPPPSFDDAWADGEHLFGGRSGATCFEIEVVVDLD